MWEGGLLQVQGAEVLQQCGNFPPGSGNWRINKNWQNTVQCCNPLSMVFAGNFRMELPQFVNKDA